jgi:hypothetical protein
MARTAASTGCTACLRVESATSAGWILVRIWASFLSRWRLPTLTLAVGHSSPIRARTNTWWIKSNGLQNRITPVNAGVSADGRTLQMPRCVIAHQGGSQMASTQWLTRGDGRGAISRNRCFSGSCSHKAELIRSCMLANPAMAHVHSVSIEAALSMATSSGLAPQTPGGTVARRPHAPVALLKVDCEGCEVSSRAHS